MAFKGGVEIMAGANIYFIMSEDEYLDLILERHRGNNRSILAFENIHLIDFTQDQI